MLVYVLAIDSCSQSWQVHLFLGNWKLARVDHVLVLTRPNIGTRARIWQSLKLRQWFLMMSTWMMFELVTHVAWCVTDRRIHQLIFSLVLWRVKHWVQLSTKGWVWIHNLLTFTFPSSLANIHNTWFWSIHTRFVKNKRLCNARLFWLYKLHR